MINVTRSSMPSYEEYCEEIKDIWDSRWLTNMGPKHEQLKVQLVDYLGVQHLELLTNGHMALELTLNALNLQGEVITTPFTFVSTTTAILRNGLKPVFCDIEQDTYTIDVTKIESLITDRTCAIMPVHVYGNVCNIDEIERIAKKYSLKVIYDAAHAFGETYKGKGIGAFGDASCFSFHATKVFNSIEGGAVCYNDTALGEKLKELRNFGIIEQEKLGDVGLNAKMNEFCAAMGICNLRHIDDEIAKRREVFNRYFTNLKDIDGIQLNKIQDGLASNYAYFPVLFDENVLGYSRDDIYEKLIEKDIFARKYFYPLTSSSPVFDRNEINKTPVAKYVSEHILTLPLYADLALDDVDRICEVISL